MSLVYNNKKLIGKCSKFTIEKVQGTSPFVMLENFEPKQPQLNENQKIKTNNNLLKINDLAFELQHGTVLTNEQWEKVEKIYKLSLMDDEEEE